MDIINMKKSFYGEYIKERENADIIENEYGFASYSFLDKMCYITDVYVIPEKRQSRIASDMCDEICVVAKERGCGKVVTSVDPKTFGATESIKAIVNYGFKVFLTDGTLIWFEKEFV